MKVFLLLLGMFIALMFEQNHAPPGREYPPEWKEVKSISEEYSLLQLTTDKASDYRLYFYTDTFIPWKKSVIFVSQRTGETNKENLGWRWDS